MRARCISLVLLIAAGVSCSRPHPEAPDAPELSVDHALGTAWGEVEVFEAPFRFRVLDGLGNVVLSSLGDDGGGGYAPLAWADGAVSYHALQSPGYTAFSAELSPWHDRFEVEEVVSEPGRLLLRLVEPDDEAAPAVLLSFRFRPRTLRVEAALLGRQAPRAWSVAFQSPSNEAFLGFGERFNRTNQRGLDVYSWTEEGGIGIGEGTTASPKNPWPNGEVMTSYPVPFFLSSERYGFWLDTTYRSEFELASRRPDAWRVWHVGPSLHFEVYVPEAVGKTPWPHQLLDEFTRATGRPAVPPPWAFGARRRVGAASMERDVPEIELMRSEDLAVTAVDDALHFYPEASQQGREAALANWVSRARELGYRVNGYYNSFVADDARGPMGALLDLGLREQWFLRRKDGSLPKLWIYTGGRVVHGHLIDFTRRSANLAYQSTFDWARQLGYSGFMYDFGEYVPWNVVASNGLTGEALHNLYPVLYARAFHEANQARGGELFAFMRSGYTGASAFMPMVWSGDPAASFEDSDGLPSVVRAGINLGLSGVPNYGSDIGGYHCVADGPRAADAELLVRWIQHAAFTPNMQDQNACVGVPNPRRKATIWKDERTLSVYRDYARLHTRLFPYLYTLSKRAHETGVPIIRHPFLEHPGELEQASVDDAYYLGPGLFVAPVVVRGARSREVRLPRGRFVSWPDGKAFRGGQEVKLEAPLERLPVLLRSGHLVPLLDERIDTLAEESSPDLVGLADVRGVYDVVGALERGQRASFAVHDGAELVASYHGAVDLSALGPAVQHPKQLRDCDACYRRTRPFPGVTRLRISTARPLALGGLELRFRGTGRVRWDLWLLGG